MTKAKQQHQTCFPQMFIEETVPFEPTFSLASRASVCLHVSSFVWIFDVKSLKWYSMPLSYAFFLSSSFSFRCCVHLVHFARRYATCVRFHGWWCIMFHCLPHKIASLETSGKRIRNEKKNSFRKKRETFHIWFREVCCGGGGLTRYFFCASIHEINLRPSLILCV